MKKYKPVYVEWIDSSFCSAQNWQYLDDLPDEKPVVCRSAAFLIKKSKKGLRIAHSVHYQVEGTQLGGVTDIPTICVKKLRYLK